MKMMMAMAMMMMTTVMMMMTTVKMTMDNTLVAGRHWSLRGQCQVVARFPLSQTSDTLRVIMSMVIALVIIIIIMIILIVLIMMIILDCCTLATVLNFKYSGGGKVIAFK